MLKKQTLIYFTGMSILTLGVGCSAGRPASLDRAQASLRQAQQNPTVAQYAPAQLGEAQATLAQAERVWSEDGDRDETSHLAYLTEQRAGIAVAVAQQKAAEDELQRLHSEASAREITLAKQRAQSLEQRAQSLEEKLAALQAKQTERGLVMSLQSGVLFEYDSAQLKPGAMKNLEPLVTFLREYPERTLVIEGHTDSTGSAGYNQELSQLRAEAVRNYLLTNGIASDRILTRGYGESFPVASNANEAGRLQNRRVEIVIANEGQQVVERR